MTRDEKTQQLVTEFGGRGAMRAYVDRHATSSLESRPAAIGWVLGDYRPHGGIVVVGYEDGKWWDTDNGDEMAGPTMWAPLPADMPTESEVMALRERADSMVAIVSSMEQLHEIVAGAKAPMRIRVESGALGKEHREELASICREVFPRGIFITADEADFLESVEQRNVRLLGTIQQFRKKS